MTKLTHSQLAATIVVEGALAQVAGTLKGKMPIPGVEVSMLERIVFTKEVWTAAIVPIGDVMLCGATETWYRSARSAIFLRSRMPLARGVSGWITSAA